METKRSSLLFIVSVLFCTNFWGKTLPSHYRHELSASIGIGRSQAKQDEKDMAQRYEGLYSLMSESNRSIADNYLPRGFEYHYRLNSKWDLGVLANWGAYANSYFTDYFRLDDAETVEDLPTEYSTAEEDCQLFIVAPSVRYTWSESGSTRCYSRLALGVMRNHLTFRYERLPFVGEKSINSNDVKGISPVFTDNTDKVKWRLAYQLTAVGGSVGIDSFRFFGELGYGCLGIVRLGVCMTF